MVRFAAVFPALAFFSILSGTVSAQTITVLGDGTTITNPSGSPVNVSDPNCNTLPQTWCAFNVRQGGEVGITGTFPRNGNGSVFFQGADGSAKADFQYFFGLNSFQLATLSSFGYDYFRDPASDNPGVQVPAMRMLITDRNPNAPKFGQLIYEPVYNSGPVTEGAWHTASVGTSSNLWLFMSGCGVFESYEVTLQAWQSGTTNQCGTTVDGNWWVYGMNVGIGSGWNGYFKGAVDNVMYRTTAMDQATVFNFEVRGGSVPVPEPSSVSGLAVGLAVLGAAPRRRRTSGTTPTISAPV